MKSKLSIFIILLVIGYSGTSQKQERSEISELNTIGFISHSILDKSRPSTTNGNYGRRIQLNIWYPAVIRENTVKMEFLDYLKVKHNELDKNQSNVDFEKTIENYYQWPLSQGANRSLIDSISSARIVMKSSMNLDFSLGKHPVILLIHGSAVDFAFLAESLVELGYIVMNVPYKGYLKKELDVNGIGMETEIRDYEFALSFLSNNPNADLENITALGFSFGGQSALAMACRNPNIKTVISYDGGIGTTFGARLLNESPFCGVENISATILHMYDASYTQNYLDKIKSFVYSDRMLVGLDQIAHWHFTSFGQLASKIPNLFGRNEFAKNGYKTILEITKGYLHTKSTNPGTSYNLPIDGFNLINKVEHLKPLYKN